MKTVMPSYTLIIRLVSILVVCMFYIAGCRSNNQTNNTEKPVNNQTVKSNPKTVDETSLNANLKKAEIVWVDEHGKPIWRASFKEGKAVQSGSNAVGELVDVKAGLYHDGKLSATMNAPKLTADSKNMVVSAFSGVMIISAEGNGSITADKLTWKSKENKIYGYGNVHMKKGHISASASEVIADTALNKASLTNAEISMK